MTPIEYQELAARTMNFELNTDERLSMLSMGLSGEAGEVTDYLKKVVYHGHTYSGETLCKELGDVMWYLSNLAYINGIDLETVMEENIKKLKERYPDGFSVEDSVERRDVVDVEVVPWEKIFYDRKFEAAAEERVEFFDDLEVPYIEMQTDSRFLRRLWYFVTNPVRYLIKGNVRW